MRIGNDINGYINGSIVNIDEVEIDLVVKALKLVKDEPMCEAHENMIGKLTSQFEYMFQEMTKIPEKGLDIQDEGGYNRSDVLQARRQIRGLDDGDWIDHV